MGDTGTPKSWYSNEPTAGEIELFEIDLFAPGRRLLPDLEAPPLLCLNLFLDIDAVNVEG